MYLYNHNDEKIFCPKYYNKVIKVISGPNNIIKTLIENDCLKTYI